MLLGLCLSLLSRLGWRERHEHEAKGVSTADRGAVFKVYQYKARMKHQTWHETPQSGRSLCNMNVAPNQLCNVGESP